MSGLPVRAFGTSAALVEVAGAEEALALALWLRSQVDAADVVPAARTVLVDGVDPEGLSALVDGFPRGQRTRLAGSGPVVEVPVTYDGPDLPDVAEELGLTVAALVEAHTAVEHVAAFCGFAPGFAYLTGSSWDVPRLATPRPRVEPGSVGLAGPYTGIYPTASPGGWRIIGTTDVVLWDVARDDPALLAPGTRVRMVAQ